MRRLLPFLVCACLLLGGCFRTLVRSAPSTREQTRVRRVVGDELLWGLVPETIELPPGEIVSVRYEVDLLMWLGRIITLGIWWPSELRIQYVPERAPAPPGGGR